MVHLIAGFALLAAQDSPANRPEALVQVEKAIRLLGGREKLASIRQVTVNVVAHDLLVEQSERPAGPFLTSYSRGKRVYDFDALSETSELTFAGLVYGDREIPRKFKIEKGAGRASTPFENFVSQRRMVLGPERALLYAAYARDLSLGRDTLFNGVPHSVVEFKWGSIPVRLFLKKATGAPSAIETTTRLPFPWTIWGDVPMTTRWGNWQVLDGGVMEPSQITTEINGYPVSDETVLSASVHLGAGTAALAGPNPTVPEDSKAMLARYKPVKVAEGITQYQGPFNTFVVEQPDGLVVIEPVLTSNFASAFLDFLTKEFPAKRVKAVVATDDAWPHFGGLRSFVARGADVYVLDLNRPIVQRLCDARHISLPDELAQHPARPRLKLVRQTTVIGKGPNQIVLYPIAGQGSERMVMAYFPAHRLLYGSDLLQKQGDGFFFAAYPKELSEAVARENLSVDKVFGEHLGPTPWKVVTDFVTKVTKG